MKQDKLAVASPRRKFLQTIATGTAVAGIATVIAPFQQLQAAPQSLTTGNDNPDEWFNKLTGKHKMVFDATGPHGIFPFAWPNLFMQTNIATGTAAKDCNAVVVFRHNAIPYAFPDAIWEKYKFGEHFNIIDPKTKQPSLRNPFWNPGPDDFKIPGVGSVALGIATLQQSGIAFCVCSMAIGVNSAVVSEKMKMYAADVKKEWINNVLPGVAPMPSGVWAVGRAQEHGCGYCFVG